MRVLVLDGNENQAVASVRSLGRAGHQVIVGSADNWSKAGWSRFSAGSFRYPDPRDTVEGFMAALVSAARAGPRSLVLPMTERTTLPVSRWRERLLEAGANVVMPPHDVVCRTLDKAETIRLASSLGVAVPATDVLENEDDARSFAARAAFPAVLKPRASEELDGDRVRTTGAPAHVATRDDVLPAFRRMRSRTRAVVAQEYVEGHGAGYFALMRDGELRADFAHRRIRDVRPTGSGSAVRESAPVDPAMRASGLAILRALRWHGPAMVEFRVRPDGAHVFMEVNGRFWHSLALAVEAGCDFPALTVELAEHGDVATPAPYRLGVRCRWLLGDLRHLVAVWQGPPAGFRGAFPGRLATLGAVLRPVRGTRHDNFRWHDPLPELGDWVDFFARRVLRARRQKRSAPA